MASRRMSASDDGHMLQNMSFWVIAAGQPGQSVPV